MAPLTLSSIRLNRTLVLCRSAEAITAVVYNWDGGQVPLAGTTFRQGDAYLGLADYGFALNITSTDSLFEIAVDAKELDALARYLEIPAPESEPRRAGIFISADLSFWPTKAERLNRALAAASGPLTSIELAEIAGVPPKHVYPLLRVDMSAGRVRAMVDPKFGTSVAYERVRSLRAVPSAAVQAP